MAHLEQYAFVLRVQRMFYPLFTGRRILGVGTRDINSSSTGYDVEKLFVDCEMTGLDLEPGPGVTHVCHAADFSPGASAGYDVVYSCEALEHDRRWRETIRAMIAWTRPGGLMFLTTAGPDRPEHGTERAYPMASPMTTDFYANLSLDALAEAIRPRDHFQWYAFEEIQTAKDVYFWGVRQ